MTQTWLLSPIFLLTRYDSISVCHPPPRFNASANHDFLFVLQVHERDLNTDFLIIILKDLLARRKELKLVLMSATLNSEAFSKYFGGCPVVSIPGRAHPVQEFRLEDVLEVTGHQVQEGSDFVLGKKSKSPKISKSALRQLYHPKYSKETIHSLSIVDEEKINYPLLADLLEHITLTQDEGAILVFMPGMMEIQKAIDEMYKKEFFQSSKVVIYPLHSSLSTAEQKAIFEVPPEGVRKVVVSTSKSVQLSCVCLTWKSLLISFVPNAKTKDIAETSITIEDVVYVVDSGRVKENRRDEVNETPTLVECWLSRASAKQRRGRAGRVRPGTAYHLFSRYVPLSGWMLTDSSFLSSLPNFIASIVFSRNQSHTRQESAGLSATGNVTRWN